MEENKVPSAYGRFLAVAEYFLGEKGVGDINSKINLTICMMNPKVQFPELIKNMKRLDSKLTPERVEQRDNLLSEIIKDFPSDYDPNTRFSLSDQTEIMISYYKQREELYKGNKD